MSLTQDTIRLGKALRKATHRSSFGNVVEWLIAEEGIRQGLVKQAA